MHLFDICMCFTNIILLTCESAVLNKVTGTEFELNTENGGTGKYISGGCCMEITWQRDENGSLQFLDQNKKLISLNRGKTYIGLIDLVESDAVLIVK